MRKRVGMLHRLMVCQGKWDEAGFLFRLLRFGQECLFQTERSNNLVRFLERMGVPIRRLEFGLIQFTLE